MRPRIVSDIINHATILVIGLLLCLYGTRAKRKPPRYHQSRPRDISINRLDDLRTLESRHDMSSRSVGRILEKNNLTRGFMAQAPTLHPPESSKGSASRWLEEIKKQNFHCVIFCDEARVETGQQHRL